MVLVSTCPLLFFLPGGHHADVCGGDDGATRPPFVPPGALHRGKVHQVQLQLWLRPGRQHQTHPSGDLPPSLFLSLSCPLSLSLSISLLSSSLSELLLKDGFGGCYDIYYSP